MLALYIRMLFYRPMTDYTSQMEQSSYAIPPTEDEADRLDDNIQALKSHLPDPEAKEALRVIGNRLIDDRDYALLQATPDVEYTRDEFARFDVMGALGSKALIAAGDLKEMKPPTPERQKSYKTGKYRSPRR